MRDEIPHDLDPGYYLINLHHSDSVGTHWTCLFIPHSGPALYFDSFGMPPPEEVRVRPLIYSTTQLQDLKSIMCGYFVIDFVKNVHDENSYHDFLYKKYHGDVDDNDRIIKGGGIHEWLTRVFPNTELHLPVLTKNGVEKALFAGPGTKLEDRIKNLDDNITREVNNEDIPQSDVITKPKSRFDRLAMHHDLAYSAAERDCDDDPNCVKKKKHAADIKLMKGNIKNALDPTNLNPLDRLQHVLSLPVFGTRMLLERIVK